MKEIQKRKQTEPAIAVSELLKTEIQHRKTDDKALLECLKQNSEVIKSHSSRLEKESKMSPEQKDALSQSIDDAARRSSDLYLQSKKWGTIRDIGVTLAVGLSAALGYAASQNNAPQTAGSENPVGETSAGNPAIIDADS